MTPRPRTSANNPSEVVRISRQRLTAVREELRAYGADPDQLSDRQIVDYALGSWVSWARRGTIPLNLLKSAEADL